MLAPGKTSLTLLLLASMPVARAQDVFCEGHPDTPTLLQGAATCIYNSAEGSTQIDLTRSSLIEWERFGVRAGGRTSFRFAPGATGTVINRSRSGIVNIQGVVEATGGGLVVASPGGSIRIGAGGSVTAPSVLLTTHAQIPEQALLAGSSSGNYVGPSGQILNEGTVRAHTGDAIILGGMVDNSGLVEAPAGNVQVAAGESVVVGQAPGDLRVVSSGRGSINQRGIIRGNNIALVAEGDVILAIGGRTETPNGSGQIFFRVGETGSIVDEGGEISGMQVINGQVTEAPKFNTDNDIPTSRTPSIARFPALTPNGRPVVRFTNSAIAGLVDSGKKSTKPIKKKSAPKVLLAGTPATRSTTAGTWLRKSSFFGARGSRPVAPPEKKKKE